jgi:hypothetical protein
VARGECRLGGMRGVSSVVVASGRRVDGITGRAVLVCPPASSVEGGDDRVRCRVEVGGCVDRGRDEARRSAQFDLDVVSREHLHQNVEGDRWLVPMPVVAGDEVLAGYCRVVPDESERSRSAPLSA